MKGHAATKNAFFAAGHSNMPLQEDGRKVKCTTTGYVGAKAIKGYTNVNALWSFRICSSSNSYISVGLSTAAGGTDDYRSANNYSVRAGSGEVLFNGTNQGSKSECVFQAGQKVTFRLNGAAGTCTMQIEDKDEVEVFTDLPKGQPLFPAVFCDYSDIVIELVESYQLRRATAGEATVPFTLGAAVPLLASSLASRLSFAAVTQAVFKESGLTGTPRGAGAGAGGAGAGAGLAPSVLRLLGSCEPIFCLLDALEFEAAMVAKADTAKAAAQVRGAVPCGAGSLWVAVVAGAAYWCGEGVDVASVLWVGSRVCCACARACVVVCALAPSCAGADGAAFV